jgi:hypothetical protein
MRCRHDEKIERQRELHADTQRGAIQSRDYGLAQAGDAFDQRLEIMQQGACGTPQHVLRIRCGALEVGPSAKRLTRTGQINGPHVGRSASSSNAATRFLRME